MSDRDDAGLDGFGGAARQAIAAAADAAVDLGTTRVGTEHLLLGVAASASSAADLLRRAGASIAAVRRKVAETNSGSGAPTAAGGVVGRSPRADRALSRAHRFAHDRRSPETRSEHLLLGILDVEGTAGQVLRGLGVDVDGLRAALAGADLTRRDGGGDDDSAGAAGTGLEGEARDTAVPRCPACDGDLAASGLATTMVPAGAGTATLLSCPACGTAIGATPA